MIFLTDRFHYTTDIFKKIIISIVRLGDWLKIKGMCVITL